jgi:hypothetical protein
VVRAIAIAAICGNDFMNSGLGFLCSLEDQTNAAFDIWATQSVAESI